MLDKDDQPDRNGVPGVSRCVMCTIIDMVKTRKSNLPGELNVCYYKMGFILPSWTMVYDR